MLTSPLDFSSTIDLDCYSEASVLRSLLGREEDENDAKTDFVRSGLEEELNGPGTTG